MSDSFKYKIAEIACSFSKTAFPAEEQLYWQQFRCEQQIKPAFTMSVQPPERCQYQMEFFTLKQPAAHVVWMESGILLANKAWSWGEIVCPRGQRPDVHGFAAQMFCTAAVRHQMLQFHCAVVEDQGRGILFVGPSGIGKTTQAECWAKYRGSTIINGDMGYVQHGREDCVAWGTPWHGSSPYCLNTSVPVKAIVVLKQSKENRLRELDGFEKVREISSSVFYPTWLEEGMELCMDILDNILTCVPVYRLDNRADQEGVALLAAELDRLYP